MTRQRQGSILDFCAVSWSKIYEYFEHYTILKVRIKSEIVAFQYSITYLYRLHLENMNVATTTCALATKFFLLLASWLLKKEVLIM
mgnify:CR=1 FL=1